MANDSHGQSALGKTKYLITPRNALQQAVRVVHDTTGQQTVSWEDPIVCMLPSATLSTTVPPGFSNLYQFPLCHIGSRMREGKTRPLEGAELECLVQLLMAMAEQDDCKFIRTVDFFGAYPLHGLLIKNSPESLALVLRLVRWSPALLVQKHASWSPFDGENTLHIVCVNQQEELLIEMIRLATAHLSRAQLEDLFWAQAQGPFFDDLPQRNYGGTPLGYAACFGLKAAITCLLEEPRLGNLTAAAEKAERGESSSTHATEPPLAAIIDLDDEEHTACKVTGFLPLHAVAANSLIDMYDFLAEMPHAEHLDHRTADEKQISLTPSAEALGREPPTIEFSGLSALQLACKMGDERMFKHILGRQTMILWRWGPVTQYMIDLAGVDSADGGLSDAMELVGSMGASESTKRFILDEVMNGFLFELFDLKWHNFAGRLHILLLLLDCAYALPLVALIFLFKHNPAFLVDETLWYHPLASRLPVGVTLAAIASLVPEALFVGLWWHAQPPWKKGLGLRRMLADLREWVSAFHVEMKV